MDWDWAAVATVFAGLLAIIGIGVSPGIAFRHRRRIEEETLAAHVVDLLRHSERNWAVLDQIIADRAAGSKLPLKVHLEKLRGVGDIVSAEGLRFLGKTERRIAVHLKHRLENQDAEIDQVIDALDKNRPAEFDALVQYLKGSVVRLRDHLGGLRLQLRRYPGDKSPLSDLTRDTKVPVTILYQSSSVTGTEEDSGSAAFPSRAHDKDA